MEIQYAKMWEISSVISTQNTSLERGLALRLCITCFIFKITLKSHP